MLFPRDENAADAAATMASTEQGGKADKHDHLHNGFGRRALAVFRATFEPGAFQDKTRDQANSLQFTVKRPFHNEISVKPGKSVST